MIHGVHSHIYLFSTLQGAILIGPSSMLLKHILILGSLPNRGTSLDPNSQTKKIAPHLAKPFQYMYMGFELWANYMG
jgi:hypothetical protein